MFTFFLKSYQSGILDFCGSDVKVKDDKNGPDAMLGFRMYDNGQFSKKEFIESSHPNVLKAVIVGKKAWGLFCGEWSDGIAEGSFTKREILSEFENKGIVIPESLKSEFENMIWKKVQKRVRRNSEGIVE